MTNTKNPRFQEYYDGKYLVREIGEYIEGHRDRLSKNHKLNIGFQ